jgi:hypothetical protein
LVNGMANTRVDHFCFHRTPQVMEDQAAGLGASHQTGWTGLVAKLIRMYGFLDPQDFLLLGGPISVSYQN